MSPARFDMATTWLPRRIETHPVRSTWKRSGSKPIPSAAPRVRAM